MTWNNPPDETIGDLLSTAKTIAVVGCSPKSHRTSHQIAATMQARGYRIIPVHPSGGTILGEKVYAALADIPSDTTIDIVDVFLRSELCATMGDEAVAIGAGGLWLQQGVVNEEAYAAATKAGIPCIMDLCIAVLHSLLVK